MGTDGARTPPPTCWGSFRHVSILTSAAPPAPAACQQGEGVRQARGCFLGSRSPGELLESVWGGRQTGETPERSAAWWTWLERALYMAWIPGRGQRGRVGVEGAHHPPPGTSSGLGQGPAWWDTDSLRAWLDLQKMDRNQDGVVTIDEFLETCQKVGSVRAWGPQCPAPASPQPSRAHVPQRLPSEGRDVEPSGQGHTGEGTWSPRHCC